MSSDQHYERLIRMYQQAPINRLYPSQLSLDKGHARIELTPGADLCHAAGTLHGSVLFKLLDDAAYFAAASRVQDQFLVTTSFHTLFMRPGKVGALHAVGRLISAGRQQLIAEASIYDERSRELARGQGCFSRSGIELNSVIEQEGDDTPS